MTCDTVRTRELGQKYLLGQLSEAEQDEFELHYFECEQCFEQLQNYRALQTVLTRQARPEGSRGIPIWKWAAVAAAILLCCAIGWRIAGSTSSRPAPVALAPTKSQPVNELATLGQITPPRYVAPTLRGLEPPGVRSFRTAMQFYVRKDYPAAIPALEAASRQDPGSPGPRFYLGICYLLESKVDQGILALRNTIALGETPYLESAHYYLATAFLRREDAAAAQRELNSTIALHGDKETEANVLRQKLHARIDATPTHVRP